MTSGSNSPKPAHERSLTKSLGALFALASGLMLGSASAANTGTASSGSAKADGIEQLEIRVQKVREQLAQGPGSEVNQGDPSSSSTDPHPMWWGNWHNWHPGWGWRNWHPGWGNGGWHNWHNWHNWGNW
jgi:rSAM-associated Gly-rich repeat protein